MPSSNFSLCNSHPEFDMNIRTTPISDRFGLIVEPVDRSPGIFPPAAQVMEWFRAHRALIFRRWDFSLEEFRAFSDQLCGEFSSYQGGGFRFKMLNREFVNGDNTVMTTTGHSQGFEIPLHGEMHYLANPPEIIWFYCQTPPRNTGQTTLCDAYELAEVLPEQVHTFFGEQQIKYLRHLRNGDWQTTFMTEDAEEAKRLCEEYGLKYTFDEEQQSFRTEYLVPPFLQSENSHKPRFINNVMNIFTTEWAFESGWIQSQFSTDLGGESPMVVRREDGERVPGTVFEQIRKAADSITYDIEWKKGDIVMVDNLSVLHGRRESNDRSREIFVRMGNASFEPAAY
jgi:alpha-ketoglutarate-dependent taurine dioxygenase